jgi:hypothetical protein
MVITVGAMHQARNVWPKSSRGPYLVGPYLRRNEIRSLDVFESALSGTVRFGPIKPDFLALGVDIYASVCAAARRDSEPRQKLPAEG